MANVKLVTGYVPIIGHTRNAAEYGVLGEKLASVTGFPVRPYYHTLSQCWMHPFIDRLSFKVTHSEGDNPEKNTLAYHIVQHQKTEWLYHASLEDHDADVFVWIDYGIFHLPGVTKEIIETFLAGVRENDLAIPGCWMTGNVYDDFPCWRFCGSVIVCPRSQVKALDSAVKEEAKRHTQQSKNVTWEVNTWARVEKQGRVPIRWYAADHNQTLFTNYLEKPDENPPL